MMAKRNERELVTLAQTDAEETVNQAGCVVDELEDIECPVKAKGRKAIAIPRAVMVELEDGCEVEISKEVLKKRGLEDAGEVVMMKKVRENEEDCEDINSSPSLNTSDSVPGSSDVYQPETSHEEVDHNEEEDDDGTDVAESDYAEEEDDYFPLSGYPLVDRFPDLGCDLAEPECGCCHCDLSDKLGPTTSEPDMVLYSDRTSDTVMSDCRYLKDRLVRDTGYNFWEVED